MLVRDNNESSNPTQTIHVAVSSAVIPADWPLKLSLFVRELKKYVIDKNVLVLRQRWKDSKLRWG